MLAISAKGQEKAFSDALVLVNVLSANVMRVPSRFSS